MAPPDARARSDEQFQSIYDELRRMAGAVRSGDATLQPTDLVHEAWLRMSRGVRWEDECHFRSIAARAMRQILVDRARRRQAHKRGGGWDRVTLSGLAQAEEVVDLLALDELMEELSALHPRQAQVVELRVYGGLSHAEVGEVLGLAEYTARKDWRLARAWLISRLRQIGVSA